MSVINKMLRDLDRRNAPEMRGARHAASPLRGSVPSLSVDISDPRRPSGMRWVAWGVVLLAAGASVYWMDDILRGFVPKTEVPKVALVPPPPIVEPAAAAPSAPPAVAEPPAQNSAPATPPATAAPVPQVAVPAAAQVAPTATPTSTTTAAVSAAAPASAPTPAPAPATAVRAAAPVAPAAAATQAAQPAPLAQPPKPPQPAPAPVQPVKAPVAPATAAAQASATSTPRAPASTIAAVPQPNTSSAVSTPIAPQDATQRQLQAGRDALAQAQGLWNSGSREAAIDMLQQAVATTERTGQTGTPAGRQLLASLVRELTRMQLADGRSSGALELLTRLEASLSSEPDLWAVRANALQRLGRHSESLQAYRNALQARPNEQRWLLGAAVSHAALGQTANANEMAEKARQQGPISRDVLTYLRQVGVQVRD